ncbi:hypothetical protein LTR27_012810 [Elasticomyces elasticus]|nr:hypothetical protein LTR27_012810 [Elasticomyces elasticus]
MDRDGHVMRQVHKLGPHRGVAPQQFPYRQNNTEDKDEQRLHNNNINLCGAGMRWNDMMTPDMNSMECYKTRDQLEE